MKRQVSEESQNLDEIRNTASHGLDYGSQAAHAIIMSPFQTATRRTECRYHFHDPSISHTAAQESDSTWLGRPCPPTTKVVGVVSSPAKHLTGQDLDTTSQLQILLADSLEVGRSACFHDVCLVYDQC